MLPAQYRPPMFYEKARRPIWPPSFSRSYFHGWRDANWISVMTASQQRVPTTSQPVELQVVLALTPFRRRFNASRIALARLKRPLLRSYPEFNEYEAAGINRALKNDASLRPSITSAQSTCKHPSPASCKSGGVSSASTARHRLRRTRALVTPCSAPLHASRNLRAGPPDLSERAAPKVAR